MQERVTLTPESWENVHETVDGDVEPKIRSALEDVGRTLELAGASGAIIEVAVIAELPSVMRERAP
jgi:hypothetical protein